LLPAVETAGYFQASYGRFMRSQWVAGRSLEFIIALGVEQAGIEGAFPREDQLPARSKSLALRANPDEGVRGYIGVWGVYPMTGTELLVVC